MDMTGIQQFALGPISAVDRKGNPAAIDGVPAFSSDNEAIAVVVEHPSGDPTMALVKAVGPNGAAQIRVAADADLGAGVETIEAFIGVNVIPEKAVGLTVPTGPVEDQP